MKFFTNKSRVIAFSILSIVYLGTSSCFDDHIDFAQMKGINYFCRHSILTPQEITFDNSAGIADAVLNKGDIVNIEPNTFVNSDGTAFDGKVYFTVVESPSRGFMAMNSVPTVSNGASLQSEGADLLRATDATGHDLKIASGHSIDFTMKGKATQYQNKMYYGDDDVADPRPNNTVLFNWVEASSDTVESYWNATESVYFYKLKPEQLGWIACSRSNVVSNTTSVKVRVWGVHPINYNNTAVYLVPKVGHSAYRLWNYDESSNTFSGDENYISNGSQFYVVVLALGKHEKMYFAKEEFTAGTNTEVKTITAVEGPSSGGFLNSVATQLLYL